MGEKKSDQTSETFLLSALLSFSGGLQDAYTYDLRGRVFANAQTGNIVLMSQNFIMRNWLDGLFYLIPVTFFVIGIFISERIEHRFKNLTAIHWRQLVLLIEIAVLFAVGFIPQSANTIANILVSLACAMQVQGFRSVNGLGYASTMCIGNLRNGTENLSIYIREKKKSALVKVLNYFGVILIFAIGAATGAVLSGWLGIKAIWASCVVLGVGCVLMHKKSLMKS